MTTPSGRKAADFFFRGLYTSGLFHISPAQPARCPPAENPMGITAAGSAW